MRRNEIRSGTMWHNAVRTCRVVAWAGMLDVVRIRSTGTTHARPRLAGGMGRGEKSVAGGV